LRFKRDILGTLGNWRVWPHVLVAISLITSTGAVGTYTPALINSFSFGSKPLSHHTHAPNVQSLNLSSSYDANQNFKPTPFPLSEAGSASSPPGDSVTSATRLDSVDPLSSLLAASIGYSGSPFSKFRLRPTSG
jgi:hypothetical protein